MQNDVFYFSLIILILFLQAKNPCAVSCMRKDKRKFVLDKTVFDGTRCYNNRSHDICLSGICEVRCSFHSVSFCLMSFRNILSHFI